MIKVQASRQAVYQLASYIGCVQGVKKIFVEVGTSSREPHPATFTLHFSVEIENKEASLQEIARLIKIARLSYVQYHDNDVEEAFETLKFEVNEL